MGEIDKVLTDGMCERGIISIHRLFSIRANRKVREIELESAQRPAGLSVDCQTFEKTKRQMLS